MPYVTQDEIVRLQTARNTIRSKFVSLGISTSADRIDALAAAANGITDRGTVKAEVREGESYTIQAGYYKGGSVLGVGGGGNYQLQEKGPIIPIKAQQTISSDDGYYGLSSVTVGAIPDNYNDTSGVNAVAADVLSPKIIVGADGSTIAGTMTNNGKVTRTLDTDTVSYTIAKGFHSGEGSVSIVLEEKSVTPTKSAQNITPTTGKVLSKVAVSAIPAEYIITTDADAIAAHILAGDTAYVDGVKVTGTMPNNGDTSKTMDGLTITSIAIPAGYTSGGTVRLDSTIAEALAAI